MIIETPLIVETIEKYHFEPMFDLKRTINSFHDIMVANNGTSPLIIGDNNNYIYKPRISPDGEPRQFSRINDDYIIYEEFVFDTDSFIINVLNHNNDYVDIDINVIHPTRPMLNSVHIKATLTTDEMNKLYDSPPIGLREILLVPNVTKIDLNKIIHDVLINRKRINIF